MVSAEDVKHAHLLAIGRSVTGDQAAALGQVVQRAHSVFKETLVG